MLVKIKSGLNVSGATSSRSEKIADTLERNPNLSYRQVARAYDVDVATVYRAAAKRPGLIEARRGRQPQRLRVRGDWQFAGQDAGQS